MTEPPRPLLSRRGLVLLSGGSVLLAACGGSDRPGTATTSEAVPLRVSAIPDQDPELLNRLYPALAERLSEALGSPIVYEPVTDYTAVVRAFEVGDVQLAWMGGLTGVQARSRVPGARALVQRDIDADFHSLFIANRRAGLAPFIEVAGLRRLAGHTLTFGSQTSTSGRLMPQYFMGRAGLTEADLSGSPGFSGSHDATIEAVASGSFEVGAVNEQVWKATVAAGEVDLGEVVVLFRTPGYVDYHWLARPDLDASFGAGTTDTVVEFLLGLARDRPEDATILDLFGAQRFVRTDNAAYGRIEQVAREQGLLT